MLFRSIRFHYDAFDKTGNDNLEENDAKMQIFKLGC